MNERMPAHEDAGEKSEALRLEDEWWQEDAGKLIVRALFSDMGLQHIVDVAARVLGNPVAVIDANYRYVARKMDVAPDDDSEFARVMRDELRSGFVSEEGIAYIHERGLDERLAQRVCPCVHFNDRLQANTLVGAAMVHGICIAHVMLVERGRAITPEDEGCFDLLVGIVAQELQKNPVYLSTRGQMGSYFLASLLENDHPDATSLERRAAAINFRPSARMRVVVAVPRNPFAQVGNMQNVAGQLQPLLAHGLYTLHKNQLVMLVCKGEGKDVTDFELGRMRDVAELNDLLLGISNRFDSLTGVHSSYEQAHDAIRYGQTVSNALEVGRIMRYDYLSYVKLLERTNQTDDLLDICPPTLVALMEHDRTHDSDLMNTLFGYLQNGQSTARASAQLSLHKNTLLYRLGTIRKILGCDLSSGEDVFQLQVGFRVLMYLGLFCPRFRHTREQLREHPRA
ncbi:PucR family transcriptional regulator [Olsenella umbonata]|uniref:PucR family transcriptional regulator n=1 Tax=Parafannyhessea umbonata TaxID=604330 RepID=A0A7X9Y1A9_9ACTN|nr:helix-turn-helix domain-containing protein [Parafannyhessea umbonata]NMF26320.1 PucR family transcriptional regulator [Parafannyhessea umbonata]